MISVLFFPLSSSIMNIVNHKLIFLFSLLKLSIWNFCYIKTKRMVHWARSNTYLHTCRGINIRCGSNTPFFLLKCIGTCLYLAINFSYFVYKSIIRRNDRYFLSNRRSFRFSSADRMCPSLQVFQSWYVSHYSKYEVHVCLSLGFYYPLLIRLNLKGCRFPNKLMHYIRLGAVGKGRYVRSDMIFPHKLRS